MKLHSLPKIGLLIIFSFTYVSDIAAQNLLTLEDAIQTALDKNYGIQIAKNEILIADNNYDRGNAGFWPTVTLNAGGNLRLDNLNNQKFSSGGEFNNSNLFSRGANAGIGLQWTIFDGMRMFATYDKLKEMRDMSELSLRTELEKLVYDISLQYFNIVKLQLQLDALKLNMDVNAERLKLEKSRSEFGKGNLLLVKQAQLDQNALLAQEKNLFNSIEIAKIELNKLLTREPSEEFSVQDSIILGETPIADSLVKMAQDANSELQVLRKTIQINQLTLKEQTAEKYPSIVVNSNYAYTQNANSAGFSIFNNSLGVTGGIGIQWNLFDGGRVKRNIANTQLQINSDQLRLEDSQLQLRSSIQQSVTNFQNAVDVAKIEDENFQLATESLAIVKERYRLGVANTLELKDAQAVYDQSANRRALALFDAKVAEINLRYVTGQMAVQ